MLLLVHVVGAGGINFLVLTGANFTFDILLLLSLLVITGVILDFKFLMDAQHITARLKLADRAGF